MQVKFNWKVQRDHEERGHSIESIKVPPTLQFRNPSGFEPKFRIMHPTPSLANHAIPSPESLGPFP